MFNGENRVLPSVTSLFAELWIKPGLWDDFEKYLVNSSARVANAGAMEALAVLESTLVGWCWFGREQNAKITVVSFAKSGKNMRFWPKNGFLAILARFWDDVSMTSLGGVKYGRVTWRSVSGPRGLLRWRTARIHGGRGGDAMVRWHDVEVTLA